MENKLKNIVELAVYFLPIICFYFYWKKTKKLNDKRIKILFLGGFIWVMVFAYGSTYFGVKKIGGFFERSEYTVKYYVLLFPDNQGSKNYKLPAEIYVYTLEGGVEDDGSQDSERRYDLQEIFFPNGGSVSFENSDNSLEIGKKITFFDSNGKEWGVELTNQKIE